MELSPQNRDNSIINARAESISVILEFENFHISLEGHENTSLICTPSCDDEPNIQIVFEDSQRKTKKMMALMLCRTRTARISPITKVKYATNEK